MTDSTLPLFDMHAHLCFFENTLASVHELSEKWGCSALCATVTPSEYEGARALGLADIAGIRLGVGLHPWWIADGSCGAAEISHAAELAHYERYIAEVGLDFNRAQIDSQQLQIDALDAIFDAAENGGHLISLHAVYSAQAVLDLLEKHNTCSNNDVIFHWFTGGGHELNRAKAMGCYFSVNHFMIQTRRGCAYTEQIPLKQLLIETDLPGSIKDGKGMSTEEYAEALRGVVQAVALIRGEDALPVIFQTSKRLLQM